MKDKKALSQKQFYDQYYKVNRIPQQPQGNKKSGIEIFFDDNNIDVEGKTVLEIGCGDGVLTQFLIKKGVSKITAIDISSNAIESLKVNFAKEIKDNKLKMFCSDAIEFMVDDKNHYDVIIGAGILHHISRSTWRAFFASLYLRLKSEGVLVFAPEPNVNGIYFWMWKMASFFYNKIYHIPYDEEVEKGTFDMKPSEIVKTIKSAKFSSVKILSFKVIPYFTLPILPTIDRYLKKVVPGSMAIYMGIIAKK